MIFDVFRVELDKGATLETDFMGDNIVTFFLNPPFKVSRQPDLKENKLDLKKDKLNFLIVDFRSLPEKPRWNKQDFPVVEHYTLAPTSIAKRWTDQPLDFIEVLSGLHFSIFFWCQTSMFSSQGYVSSWLENYPLENCSPNKSPPGRCPLDNCLPVNCPWDDCPLCFFLSFK